MCLHFPIVIWWSLICVSPCMCVCGCVFIAVQQMAEAQMLKLGVYPHVEEEGEEPIQREREELSSSCTPGNLNITSQRKLLHVHVVCGQEI